MPLLAGLYSVAASIGTALAQVADPAATSFGLIDKNGDGSIDVEEHRSRMMDARSEVS